MKKLIMLLLALPLISLNTACTSDIGASQYETSSIGSVNKVVIGTIIDAQPIMVRDDDTSGGEFLGGIAGGVAGSQIGSGSTAATLGAVGGALLGGVVGGMTEKKLSEQGGYQYVIKTESGQLLTVTQGTDIILSVGQRCMILYGNGQSRARVVPYNY